MSFDIAHEQKLKSWLKSMERRRRAAMLLQATARAFAGVIVYVALLVSADRWLVLPAVVREIAIAVLAIAVAALAAWMLYRTFRPIDIVQAAQAIEQYRPPFDERLITLAHPPDPIDPTIARQLQLGVSQVLDAQPLQVAWPMRRTLLTVVVSISLLTVSVIAIHQKIWTRELHRVLRPWSPLPATLAPQLRITASPTTLRRYDQQVTVEATTTAGDLDAVVLHVTDTTGETAIAMTRQGQSRFVRTLSNLLQPVTLYATAGDLHSRTIRIGFASH